MKTRKIEQLNREQITGLILELFDFIELTYGISKADSRFLEYFTNHLMKYFKNLSFENIESAFERNASGLLDTYLPKVGARADNKVSKFNIPELTKVINAYCRYVGIEKNDNETEKIKFTNEQKNSSVNAWCDSLCIKFDNAINNSAPQRFFCSMFAANFLAELGLLDASRIERNEQIGSNFQRKSFNNNELLIYETFKQMHESGLHISDYLGAFRNKYNFNEIW